MPWSWLSFDYDVRKQRQFYLSSVLRHDTQSSPSHYLHPSCTVLWWKWEELLVENSTTFKLSQLNLQVYVSSEEPVFGALSQGYALKGNISNTCNILLVAPRFDKKAIICHTLNKNIETWYFCGSCSCTVVSTLSCKMPLMYKNISYRITDNSHQTVSSALIHYPKSQDSLDIYLFSLTLFLIFFLILLIRKATVPHSHTPNDASVLPQQTCGHFCSKLTLSNQISYITYKMNPL